MVFMALEFSRVAASRIKADRPTIDDFPRTPGQRDGHEIFIAREKAEISRHDEKNTFGIDSICQRAANCVIMPRFCAPKRLDHQ